MASQGPQPPPNPRVISEPLVSRRQRDLLAAVLMAGGTAGSLSAAWLYSPLAGLAATSVASLTLGILLGME